MYSNENIPPKNVHLSICEVEPDQGLVVQVLVQMLIFEPLHDPKSLGSWYIEVALQAVQWCLSA